MTGRLAGGCNLLSPPSPPVTVFEPLASLTLSLVTTLLELDELDFELELELGSFSGSLDDEDDLEADADDLSDDEDAFAFSASRALRADASAFDLEPENEDDLDTVACGVGVSLSLLSSWLSIWSENMSNKPKAKTRLTTCFSEGVPSGPRLTKA